MPRLGALLSTVALLHPSFRVHVVERRRVVSEDALLLRAFTRKGVSSRPVATVLLAGRGTLRAEGAVLDLGPGDLAVVPRKGAVSMRQEGDPYLAVVFEWDPGSLSDERPDAPRKSRAPRPLLAAAERLAGTDVAADPLSALVAFVEKGRAGFPLRTPDRDAWAVELSDVQHKLATALDGLHSTLEGRPMLVDLEDALSLSARHLNRLVSDHNARFGFNAGNWRDTRNRWRLLMGATLMTADGATSELVSRVVGYSSSATMCRAFSRAGLPTPGETRELVRSLGPG